MKAWGIAATLGFAALAFGFGQAVGVGAVTAAMGADLSRVAFIASMGMRRPSGYSCRPV